MDSSALALRTAVVARLAGDAATLAALGGARIYDDPPTRAEFPYMTFGQSSERDWSTGSDEGFEHLLTLHVWSRAAGRKQAETAIAAALTALHDQPLELDGHRMINLRHEFTDARRESDGLTYRASARFRAVTEVL